MTARTTRKDRRPVRLCHTFPSRKPAVQVRPPSHARARSCPQSRYAPVFRVSCRRKTRFLPSASPAIRNSRCMPAGSLYWLHRARGSRYFQAFAVGLSSTGNKTDRVVEAGTGLRCVQHCHADSPAIGSQYHGGRYRRPSIRHRLRTRGTASGCRPSPHGRSIAAN